MKHTILEGRASMMGQAYGATHRKAVQKNIEFLLKNKDFEKSCCYWKQKHLKQWINEQHELIKENWPWLLEEIKGVAKGADVKFDEILILNLRIWQYDLYSGRPYSGECSNLAIRLKDDSIAIAGTLDDNRILYDGLFTFIPDNGYSFFVFPIIGTVWGSRGVNSAGLALGTSSQRLPGIQRFPHSINHDIAVRVILQTCSTVAEVREFCRRFHFTVNLVCTDKTGEFFCAHNTSAGLFELPNDLPSALTNHITEDTILYELAAKGLVTPLESPTTRLRRGKLLAFAHEKGGECEAEDLRQLVIDFNNDAPSSICPKHNVVVTYANPQTEPTRFWVAAPRDTNNDKWTIYEL